MAKFVIEINLGNAALPDETEADRDIAADEISRIFIRMSR